MSYRKQQKNVCLSRLSFYLFLNTQAFVNYCSLFQVQQNKNENASQNKIYTNNVTYNIETNSDVVKYKNAC